MYQFLLLQTVQHGASGGQRDGVSVVGKAVQEGSRGNSIYDFFGGDDRAQRSVAAGETLGCDQNVGRDVPVFDGEVLSGAAHAGHDFVGDQQDAVAPADFRHLLQISRRRNDRAQRGPADRFEDESGGFTVSGFNRSLQLGRIFQSAVAAAVRAVVVAAIAVRNSHVRELAHHGQINFAPPLVAGNRERAQGRAVITLRPAEHLVTLGLSNLYLILPRQLQRRFDRFRSAAGEVHGAAAKILSGKFQQLSRVFFRDWSGELAGMDELQLRGLLRPWRRRFRGRRVR